MSLLQSERLRLLLWSLFLVLATLALDLRHNQFPYYYHPDEPGKAEQILTGRFNFHHPMLLLTTTNVAVDFFRVPRTEQAIVEMGRRVSALFTALAVVALSLTAYLWRGWPAAILAGAALATHHQLYELSHYMKEDTALLMGLAFAFLTCVAYAQRASAGRALFIGVACGLAISGKYLGAVALLIAAPVIWIGSAGARPARFGLFAAGLIAVLAAVNFPLLWDLASPRGGAFNASFSREVGLVVHGQGDSTRSVPHALYWNVFVDNSTPAIWVCLAAFLTAWPHRRSLRPIAERLLAAFPFGLALALSFSPKENDRYFLPATAIFTLLAALGVEDLPYFLSRIAAIFGAQHPERIFTAPQRRAIMFGAGALLLILQITGWSPTKPGLYRYDHAFTRDDIADLQAWMRAELPPNVTVVADSRTGLRDPARKRPVIQNPPPQRVIVKKMAAEVGTLAKLRADGVAYVAISESLYGRYFRDNLRPKDATDEKFANARAFYEELLRTGEPVFERDRGTVIYLHPGIRVYRLGPG